MSDSRSHARCRRGLIRDKLRSCVECSLRWLQTGLRLSAAPPGVYAIASRKRSVLHVNSGVLFAIIVNRVPPSLDFGSLRFSARPAHWSYDGSARRPAEALRIQSARIALPDPACVVSLDEWHYASVEIGDSSYGEMQVGSRSARRHVSRAVKILHLGIWPFKFMSCSRREM